MIRQACLASKASLNLARSLNPRPPSFFEICRCFQAIHGIPFDYAVFSHQNLIKIESISAITPIGNLKQDIE